MSDVTPHVQVLGVSHACAPVSVLEKLSFNEGEVEAIYSQLPGCGAQDAMVLSTCNRTEIYALHSDPGTFRTQCEALLRDVAGEQRWPGSEIFYQHDGRSSINHLFRVACGLESMVLGEQQILGQVKSAYELRRSRLGAGLPLESVFSRALLVGRRARAQTQIGEGVVSVASAAVHLASRIHSDLSQSNIVVVGAGDTGRLLVEHFSKLQPQQITVLNRTVEKAEALAASVGGKAGGLESLSEVLGQADVVAFAVSTDGPLLDAPTAQEAIAERRGTSLAILDLGLPRNVSSEVNELGNVFLHDLDSIRYVVDASVKRRRKEVPRVEEMINREIDRLGHEAQERGVGPLIGALRASVESMRQAEVEKFSGQLSAEQKQAVDAATRAVVNKLLHGPVTRIKDFAKSEDGEKIEVIRTAFDSVGDKNEE